MESIKSDTHLIKTNCGNLYVIVTEDKKLFFRLGKSGTCTSCNLNVISYMASKLWRAEGKIDSVIQVMSGNTCGNGNNAHSSCIDGISKILVQYCKVEDECNQGNGV